MTIVLRSSSEPPEVSSSSDMPELQEVNQKTGLRGGFPIRINGLALGSQENLSGISAYGGSSADLFGPRVGGSRPGSVTPDSVGSISGGRRRSLRGTTPVKIAGVQLLRSPSPPPSVDDGFALATPFGPVHGGWGSAAFGSTHSSGGGGAGRKRHSSTRAGGGAATLVDARLRSQPHSSLSPQTTQPSNSFPLVKDTFTEGTETLQREEMYQGWDLNLNLNEFGPDVPTLEARKALEQLSEAVPRDTEPVGQIYLDLQPPEHPPPLTEGFQLRRPNYFQTRAELRPSLPDTSVPLTFTTKSYPEGTNQTITDSHEAGNRIKTVASNLPSIPSTSYLGESMMSEKVKELNSSSMEHQFVNCRSSLENQLLSGVSSQEQKLETNSVGMTKQEESDRSSILSYHMATSTYSLKEHMEFKSTSLEKNIISKSSHVQQKIVSNNMTQDHLAVSKNKSHEHHQANSYKNLEQGIDFSRRSLEQPAVFNGMSIEAEKHLVSNDKTVDQHMAPDDGTVDQHAMSNNSSSLDSVLSNMKNTLKSLKSQVTRKTLHELNREMTPFDLPALSPVPQRACLQQQVVVDMQAVLDQDRVHVEEVHVGVRRADSEDEPVGIGHSQNLGNTYRTLMRTQATEKESLSNINYKDIDIFCWTFILYSP
jgi:hypothetical protein